MKSGFARALIISAVALTVAGCATDGSGESPFTSVPAIIKAAVVGVPNPVSRNDLAVATASYVATARLAAGYRRLRMCRTSELQNYAAVCARHSVLVTIRNTNRQAYTALTKATRFVEDNPTVNAAVIIRTAVDAVNAFRDTVPTAGAN